MKMTWSRMLGALLLVPALLAAGCGFQLRGGAVLPASLGPVYLNAPVSEFLLREEIERRLLSGGIELVELPSAAATILEVQPTGFDRRVLSVGGDAEVREYELQYGITYALRDSAGEPLAPSRRIALARDYSSDPDNVLGRESEQRRLESEMVVDAVEQMLRRLQVALR